MLLSLTAVPYLLATVAFNGGVASYTRFSSAQQDERTIADQQRTCQDRAARDGLKIGSPLEFADEAISGAKHSREGFDRMLAAARAGQIQVLYLANLSRLARDLVLTLQVLQALVYVHKIRVVCIDEGLDTSQNENWELLAAIFGSQNQQYLKMLARNVFRGQEGVVLDMLCVGDYCFGFSSEPVPGTESRRKGRNKAPKTRYVIELVEAEWVIKIFHWFVVERRSSRWIARELNRCRAPKDHRATTDKWYHQLLLGLLSNRKYIGWWPWGENKNVRDLAGKIHQEKRSAAETEKWIRHFPDLQFIDDDTFAKAQALIEESAQAHGKRRGDKGQLRGSSENSSKAHPRHLLSVLMECECCHRRFNVGGPNGKYLFCRGYRMGDCQCQTTLRRDRAEKLILEAIGQTILSNPVWVDLLHALAVRAFEKLQRELPSQRKAAESALADVNRRISNLVENCENGVIEELDARIKELGAQKEKLMADLKTFQANGDAASAPPTRAWIEEKLADLRSTLNGHGPAAAHALRALVGGKIGLTEIRCPGRKRHFLRGRLELRLRTIADAIGANVDVESIGDSKSVEVIEIDFRELEQYEQIADEAKLRWDSGFTEKEIAKQLDCNRATVTRALKHWYEQRGVPRPDGRACRKRLNRPHLSDKLQDEIWSLFQSDVSITQIAERLDCCLETVRDAVVKSHVARGLSVPDGRARRREIRLRKRAAG